MEQQVLELRTPVKWEYVEKLILEYGYDSSLFRKKIINTALPDFCDGIYYSETNRDEHEEIYTF